MLARGSKPSRAVLLCYAVSFSLVVAGWLGVRGSVAAFLILAALILGVVLAVAIQLGAIRITHAQAGSGVALYVTEGTAGRLT